MTALPPLKLPLGSPHHAPDFPRTVITAKNAITIHEAQRGIYELSGKKHNASRTYSLMAQHSLAPKALASVHMGRINLSWVVR